MCYDLDMVSAIRQHVKVQAGGLIEIRSPELSAGSDAEVIILVEKGEAMPSSSGLSQFIGAAKGIYASAEEADQFIRSERDSWEV
jgi:hypothetical protein